MKYFLSGGGSGGHLTPIIAVAEELRKRQPEVEIHAVVHRGDHLNRIIHENHLFDKVHPIYAGKLRRYHGQGLKGIGLKDSVKNIRDLFYIGLGFVQACYLMIRYKPNALLMRGGYVGVPLGFAARFFGRPYMTHDSDAVASLANRLISSGASAHAVSATPEHYPYRQSKTHLTGIPLKGEFKKVLPAAQLAAKQKLGYKKTDKIILITGGGLGADRLNIGSAKQLLPLIENNQSVHIIHLSGKSHQAKTEKSYKGNSRAKVFGFREDMADLSAASDIIVTRAGATSMAEFAVQGKAMIIVPNPLLTGGHQLHNALEYQANGAGEVIDEAELSQKLRTTVEALLADDTRRKVMGQEATALISDNSTGKVVDILQKIQRDNR